MLQQLLIIFAVNYAGILITDFLHLPLPGTITGMFLLLGLLVSGILKLKNIEKTADFILMNMMFLFLPPSVKLLSYMTLLKESFFRILILIIVTTVITMVVTGKTVNYLIERGEKKKNGNSK